MDRSGSSGEGMPTGQGPSVIARPLPIYGIRCKVFEEAIKPIFCSTVTAAESPGLANQNKQFFLLQGREFGMGSKNHVLRRLAFQTRNRLSQEQCANTPRRGYINSPGRP